MSLTAALLSIVVCAGGPELQLRDARTPAGPDVVGVWPAGLGIGAASEDGGVLIELVPWDEVLAVPSPWGGASSAWIDAGERLWRARRRLARGDIPGAEPLLEPLASEFKGQAGPTPALIADGLLQCRIARGSVVGAVGPWVAWMGALEQGGAGIPLPAFEWRKACRTESVDEESGLAPALPPIFVSHPALHQLLESGRRYEGDESAAAWFARVYGAAAAFELGQDGLLPEFEPQAPGARLVYEIVRSRVGNAEQRADSRVYLEQELAGSGRAWRRAWCMTAIGRSLIREPDPALVERGVVVLLRVAANDTDRRGYLAGVALSEASRALSALGRVDEAATLRAALERDHPWHRAMFEPLPISRTDDNTKARAPGLEIEHRDGMD